jgi:hypothetical protein
MEKKLYGFYSANGAEWSGYCIYKGVDGKEVKVTEVCTSETNCLTTWEDNVFVGEVKECVEVHQKEPSMPDEDNYWEEILRP